MLHSTGRYVLTLLIAGLTTGAVDPKPPPAPLDQEEYLDADDWFQAGLALNGEAKYREAVDAFGKSLSIEPENPLSWLNLGTSQALLGDYPRAIDSLKKSIELNPQLPLGYSNLAEVCFRSERFREAAEAYQALLDLWPENGSALYKLGLTHLFLNDAQKAQGEYLLLKIVDPELAEQLLEAITENAFH